MIALAVGLASTEPGLISPNLGFSNVTNARVTTNGSRHDTSGYAAAADRVSVNVTTGAGSVTIR